MCRSVCPISLEGYRLTCREIVGNCGPSVDSETRPHKHILLLFPGEYIVRLENSGEFEYMLVDLLHVVCMPACVCLCGFVY